MGFAGGWGVLRLLPAPGKEGLGIFPPEDAGTESGCLTCCTKAPWARMPGAPTLTSDAQTWAWSPEGGLRAARAPCPAKAQPWSASCSSLWAPLRPSMLPLWPGPGSAGWARPWAPASLVLSQGGTDWPPRHWPWGCSGHSPSLGPGVPKSLPRLVLCSPVKSSSREMPPNTWSFRVNKTGR